MQAGRCPACPAAGCIFACVCGHTRDPCRTQPCTASPGLSHCLLWVLTPQACAVWLAALAVLSLTSLVALRLGGPLFGPQPAATVLEQDDSCPSHAVSTCCVYPVSPPTRLRACLCPVSLPMRAEGQDCDDRTESVADALLHATPQWPNALDSGLLTALDLSLPAALLLLVIVNGEDGCPGWLSIIIATFIFATYADLMSALAALPVLTVALLQDKSPGSQQCAVCGYDACCMSLRYLLLPCACRAVPLLPTFTLCLPCSGPFCRASFMPAVFAQSPDPSQPGPNGSGATRVCWRTWLPSRSPCCHPLSAACYGRCGRTPPLWPTILPAVCDWFGGWIANKYIVFRRQFQTLYATQLSIQTAISLKQSGI